MAYTLTFGKYKGQDMENVFQIDPSYVQWLSDKSYNPVARQADDKVLNAAKRESANVVRSLDSVLGDMLDEMDKKELIPHLTDYEYEIRVNSNQTEIQFEIGHCLDDEGWNVLEIRSYLPQEETEEHYEGWEDTPRPARSTAVAPVPTSESAIWYAFPDNLGEKPLNVAPLTLVEAVKCLEEHLNK